MKTSFTAALFLALMLPLCLELASVQAVNGRDGEYFDNDKIFRGEVDLGQYRGRILVIECNKNTGKNTGYTGKLQSLGGLPKGFTEGQQVIVRTRSGKEWAQSGNEFTLSYVSTASVHPE